MSLPKYQWCAKCQEEKKISKVWYEGSSQTAIAAPRPYWDTYGQFHDHNHNKTKHCYRCSEGHTWTEEERKRCPTCG